MSRPRDVHDRSGYSAHSSSLVEYGLENGSSSSSRHDKDKEGGKKGSGIVAVDDRRGKAGREPGPDGRTTAGKGEKR